MPEVRDHFPEYSSMDVAELHIAKEKILSAPDSFEEGVVGDYKKLLDEPLIRILAITRALRKKAATPGGSGRKRPASKGASTLESLA